LRYVTLTALLGSADVVSRYTYTNPPLEDRNVPRLERMRLRAPASPSVKGSGSAG